MPKKKDNYRCLVRDGVVGKYIKTDNPPEIPSKFSSNLFNHQHLLQQTIFSFLVINVWTSKTLSQPTSSSPSSQMSKLAKCSNPPTKLLSSFSTSFTNLVYVGQNNPPSTNNYGNKQQHHDASVNYYLGNHG